MNDETRDLILNIFEDSLDAQLRAVRRLRQAQPASTESRPPKGLSQVDMAFDILKEARAPLHVSEILDRMQARFGRAVDRESLVSSLTKKVARNDRFLRPEKRCLFEGYTCTMIAPALGVANEYARIYHFGRQLSQMLQARIRRHVGMAALIVSSCAILLSQSSRSPTFEVVSVRRVDGKPGDPGFKVTVRGGPGTSDPGMVIYTNQNLLSMVYFAYNQYVDATTPAWIGTEHYNISAKIPPGTTLADFHLMLQNLLADRFHMAVHHETRDYDGYDLLVARGGPKMKKSSEEDSAAADRPTAEQLASGPLLSGNLDAKGYPQLLRAGIATAPIKNSIALHLMARAQTLSELIKVLQNFLGSPIVDKTGLSGRYDCTLDFLRLAPVAGMEEPNDLIPYIPLAVDALGLKMVPVKVPVDTLVVDSAERIPTEN